MPFNLVAVAAGDARPLPHTQVEEGWSRETLTFFTTLLPYPPSISIHRNEFLEGEKAITRLLASPSPSYLKIATSDGE